MHPAPLLPRARQGSCLLSRLEDINWPWDEHPRVGVQRQGGQWARHGRGMGSGVEWGDWAGGGLHLDARDAKGRPFTPVTPRAPSRQHCGWAAPVQGRWWREGSGMSAGCCARAAVAHSGVQCGNGVHWGGVCWRCACMGPSVRTGKASPLMWLHRFYAVGASSSSALQEAPRTRLHTWRSLARADMGACRRILVELVGSGC